MPQTFTVGSRSLFVNAVAWAAVLSALLLIGSAASAYLATLPAPAQALVAGWPTLVPDLLPWLQLAALALAGVTVAAAVGLLRRRDWARRAFIALLGLAIALNLAGLGLQQALVLWLVQATLSHAVLPQAVAPVFEGFVVATRSMSALVTLGGCVLLAGVAWRLSQPMIRQEFAAA